MTNDTEGYVLAPSAEVWNDRAPQILRSIELRIRQISRDVARSVGAGTEAESGGMSGAASSAGSGNDAAVKDDTVSQLVDSGQRLMTDFAIGALIATPTLIVATAFITRLDAVTSRRRTSAKPPRNAVI